MEAKEFLDLLRDEGDIICVACYGHDGNPIGRGTAVVFDRDNNIAVMLGDCGSPNVTKIKAGAIVKFSTHPEAEHRVIGTPAYADPTKIDGMRVF